MSSSLSIPHVLFSRFFWDRNEGRRYESGALGLWLLNPGAVSGVLVRFRCTSPPLFCSQIPTYVVAGYPARLTALDAPSPPLPSRHHCICGPRVMFIYPKPRPHEN